MRPQEDKIQAIREATRPQTKRQMKSFFGLAGFYRRFIPSFSSIASPLTDLTKKDRPNSIKDWQDKDEKAFQTLKTRLTSSPILRMPVFRDEMPFVLRTDASDVGVGAVLLQEFEGEGRLPIAYASKKLLPREKNYSTIEKECLGIIWGIEKFRKYLQGVNKVRRHCSITYNFLIDVHSILKLYRHIHLFNTKVRTLLHLLQLYFI